MVEILQNFVAFLEYTNFKTRQHVIFAKLTQFLKKPGTSIFVLTPLNTYVFFPLTGMTLLKIKNVKNHLVSQI